jgi:hypothetical protein
MEQTPLFDGFFTTKQPHALNGRKQSAAHIEKRRARMVGKPKSVETRKKISATLTGRPSTSSTKYKKGQLAHNRANPDHKFIDAGLGYVMVRSAYSKNGWRREHTTMAERVLGRKIRNGEEVHHINGVKTDNRNDNFVICSGAYHRMIERLMSTIYQLENFGGRSHADAVSEAHAMLQARIL